MGRPKGTPKSGGRKKGTPNKATKAGREVIMSVVEGYINGKLLEDLEQLDPLERIKAYTAMLPYVMPKLQSTALDVTTSDSRSSIEERLLELSREKDPDQ